MKLNLSEIASIAEIAAAIGVILSLVFVGVRMKEGNRETWSATAHAIFDSELVMGNTFLEHAEIWNKILDGETLQDGEELRRGIIIFNMAIMETENRYTQFKSGYVSEADWLSTLEGNRPLRNSSMYEIWRLSGGATNRSLEFRELLHNL